MTRLRWITICLVLSAMLPTTLHAQDPGQRDRAREEERRKDLDEPKQDPDAVADDEEAAAGESGFHQDLLYDYGGWLRTEGIHYDDEPFHLFERPDAIKDTG